MTGYGGLGVELGGVGAGHVADVAGELGDGALHAQADAEERHAVLAAVADGLDLALDAAVAEAAGHEDAVGAAEPLGDRLRRELLGVDPEQVELAAVEDGRVLERLPHGQVGVVQLHVLAHEGDGHRLVAGVDVLDERLPLGQVGRPDVEPEHLDHEVVELLAVQVQDDAIDVVGVAGRDDGLGIDVAEEGDLVADALRRAAPRSGRR